VAGARGIDPRKEGLVDCGCSEESARSPGGVDGRDADLVDSECETAMAIADLLILGTFTIKERDSKEFSGCELSRDPVRDVLESLILAQDKRWRRT
jgi:hypothetical protein